MQTASTEDDELDLQARIGLLGTPEEREQALELLYRRFAKPIMKFLARKFGDLTSDERASAVHDGFRVVHDKAVDGTLNVDEPLTGLLFTVAKRKALDFRRRNSSRIRADVELTEHVGDYLAGTETGRDWSLVVTLGKAEEVCEEFRKFVGSLKGQQLKVASVMADFLPDWLDNQEIANEVFVRTGKRITVMEVKGAKIALMAKFKAIIKQKLS
jgi:DNA-directed RNA polymerase specialized sigma24 family protein